MYKYIPAVLVLMLSFIYAQNDSTVSPVKLADLNDKEENIPFQGNKIVIIFYVDPDVQGLTDPLSDALEAEKFPLDKIAIIGVANCKETWIPNSIIRKKAQKQQKRFPQSLILLDYSRLVAKAWNLGDCNNKLVVVIVGKNQKIVYRKVITSEGESKASVPLFLEAIRKRIR